MPFLSFFFFLADVWTRTQTIMNGYLALFSTFMSQSTSSLVWGACDSWLTLLASKLVFCAYEIVI